MEPARRLAPLLLLMAILALSPAASAFSLTEPQLRSRLGQRLDLRLELQHTVGEEPEVRMAGNAEYARLGVEPPSRRLGDLSVEREVLSEGRVQLRVRSSNRVAEPILTVLLEVREGNTRLVREITTFIDPPAGSPEVEPVVTGSMPPLVQSLALEPRLPSTEPPRSPRRAREKSADTTDTAAPAANAGPLPPPALVPAAAPVAATPAIPLPRFRLDDGSVDMADRAEVKIAPATARWLQAQQGGAPVAAAAAPTIPHPESTAIAAPPTANPAAALPGDWPPPPWQSFAGLLALTVAIFGYSRRLRRRLMQEARAELSLEEGAAA